MGHWARIDDNNIVQEVLVLKKEEIDTGNWGDPSKWIKTSYNTSDGEHYIPKEHQDWENKNPDQSKALRWRFAAPGMRYDSVNDVFIDPQPFSSWVLNQKTWTWDPPYEHPELTQEQLLKGDFYEWHEEEYKKDNAKGWLLQINSANPGSNEKPYPSFTWDDDEGWVAPVAYPGGEEGDGKDYIWNETDKQWDLL